MRQITQYLAVTIAFILAASTVGCGNSFRGATGSSTASSLSSAKVDVSAQMAKAQAASVDAEKAIADAQAAIGEIMDEQGHIRLSMFSAKPSSQTQTTGLLAPLLAKLNPVFDRLFAKITKVKTQYDTARAALTDALYKLNPMDPAQVATIEEIKAKMAEIDGMEAAFRSSMHNLGNRLDLAVSGLDRLVSLGTSFIPVPGLGAVAGILIDLFVTSDVKDLVASVKARLEAV